MKQRVLVCGGRYYKNEALVRQVLDEFHLKNRVVALMQGGATGADSFAARWARDNELPEVMTFYPDWGQFGRAAGPKRNQLMLDVGKPTIVIAFSGGRGTADMIQRAEKAGVPVRKVL